MHLQTQERLLWLTTTVLCVAVTYTILSNQNIQIKHSSVNVTHEDVSYEIEWEYESTLEKNLHNGPLGIMRMLWITPLYTLRISEYSTVDMQPNILKIAEVAIQTFVQFQQANSDTVVKNGWEINGTRILVLCSVYIYIYIYVCVCVCHIYIYIYIYIYGYISVFITVFIGVNQKFFEWQHSGAWQKKFAVLPEMKLLLNFFHFGTDIFLRTIGHTEEEIKNRQRDIHVWVNVHLDGVFHMEHTHPENLVSGVFYIHMPKNAGAIVFADPRGPMPPFDARMSFKPDVGDLILFPSWLSHQVGYN